MIFRTCDYWGANLDPGEICDCREQKAPAERTCCENAAQYIKNAHSDQKGGKNRCH